jgi:cell division protein FtsL
MLKLLLCLVTTMLLAVLLLQLRQQRLELNYQTNKLHAQIEAQQARLWNQQLQIAIYTAPNAIVQTVANNDLKMVPQTPLPPNAPEWIDYPGDPE